MSSSSSSNNPVIVSASGKHTATLIFLHGLGDTGHGWASTLADVRPPHVRIVCPTAPTIPVTLNSGFQMPAWFDLMTLDANGPEDDAGIKKARGRIEGLIEEEINKNGIDPSRIIVGGFSQGGALAFYTGLSGKYKLGGILALSCWLPLHKEFPSKSSGREDVPCLQLHGDCDPVVPYRWGQLTSTTLKGFLTDHEFKTYKGLMHSSNPAELQDIQQFLNKILPPIESSK